MGKLIPSGFDAQEDHSNLGAVAVDENRPRVRGHQQRQGFGEGRRALLLLLGMKGVGE